MTDSNDQPKKQTNIDAPSTQLGVIGYDLPKIHTLLNDIFSEDDLRDYCLTHDPFRPVHEQLKDSDRKGDILRKMLDHARKKGLLAKLLAWAKEANKARYAAGVPYET